MVSSQSILKTPVDTIGITNMAAIVQNMFHLIMMTQIDLGKDRTTVAIALRSIWRTLSQETKQKPLSQQLTQLIRPFTLAEKIPIWRQTPAMDQ